MDAFKWNYIEYESKRDKDKTVSIKEYLNRIRPYLVDIINNHKTQGKWEIQLTVAINFLSSKDPDEIRTILTNSDNIEIMTSNEKDKITEELFECLLQRYQEILAEWREVNLFLIVLIYCIINFIK